MDLYKGNANINITLEYLNELETKRRIIPLFYLTLLLILGIPGNIFIIFVYIVKFKRKRKHRTFVIALAVMDLLVCTFTIPFEIGQMTHELTFYEEGVCKLGRTLNSIFTMSSALILVGLSSNRYQRICHPLGNQITYKQTLVCIFFIVCFSVLFALPESYLSGIKFHDLGNNFTGVDCSNDHDYADTSYPFIYSVIILVIYIPCMLTLLIMCFLIGRDILRHIKFENSFKLVRMISSSLKLSNSTVVLEEPEVKLVTKPKRHIFKKWSNSKNTKRKPDSPMKVTRTAMTVSMCFVVVFIPYIVLKLLSALTKGNIMPPSAFASAFLPTISRTHLMNNVVNFVVYIAIDLSFRKHCKEIVIYFIRKLYIVICRKRGS